MQKTSAVSFSETWINVNPRQRRSPFKTQSEIKKCNRICVHSVLRALYEFGPKNLNLNQCSQHGTIFGETVICVVSQSVRSVSFLLLQFGSAPPRIIASRLSFRDLSASVSHYFSFFLFRSPAPSQSSSFLLFLSALSFGLPTRNLFICERVILPECMPDSLSLPLVICSATGFPCAHLHTYVQRKKYPRKFIRETHTGPSGYLVFRRRKPEDGDLLLLLRMDMFMLKFMISGKCRIFLYYPEFVKHFLMCDASSKCMCRYMNKG